MDRNYHIQVLFDNMLDDVKYIQRNYLLKRQSK